MQLLTPRLSRIQVPILSCYLCRIYALTFQIHDNVLAGYVAHVPTTRLLIVPQVVAQYHLIFHQIILHFTRLHESMPTAPTTFYSRDDKL